MTSLVGAACLATGIVEECTTKGPLARLFETAALCQPASSATLGRVNALTRSEAMQTSTFSAKATVRREGSATALGGASVEPFAHTDDLLDICKTIPLIDGTDSRGRKGMKWESEALWLKARSYADLAHEAPVGDPHFPFFSSLPLDFLAKAALAGVDPALLAKPDDDGGSLFHAFGFEIRTQPQTLEMSTVYLRLMTAVAAANRTEARGE